MPAFLARLLRSLTPTTLSAQLAGMLIGGILLLHGVATVTVQRVEERQAARSALLEQANSLALSLQLLHSEPFEYKRSLLERLERLDVVHLSLGDAPNPARQAQDERALYLRDRLRKNLNSIETDLDTREMLTEVQRVHVADSMNPTLRRHVPWTHVYESRASVRLDDGKWLCVVISSDAYDFSPSQASLAMLLLEAGLLILLILVVVHRMVRPLRVLSGKAESFGRNLYTAPLPEDGPTEVREAARAFNKMQERIRAGVGQHERILAAVAHDLRTPLTRIRLRVEGMDPASPLRAKLLGDIDILGGIMANSAELTRGSARDEAAVRMDMNALLDSLVSDRQDMGQDVMLEGHCRQPWTVRPNSLRRCLSNLLDNALRYSARVRIRLLEKADVLQIDVLDDGPGIPPEMLEQVFEPFFRLDEARSPHTGGSGLGLSIVKYLVELMGGSISVNSAKGKGSTFTVQLTLPYAEEFAEKDSITAEQNLHGLHLLLAEDNPLNQELCLELLKSRGISSDCAVNGKEALELFTNSDPGTYALILMDIQMPVLDGYQTTQAIRSSTHPQAQTIPIISLSADAFTEDIRRAYASGMNDHVSKPIVPEELFAAITRVLKKPD